MFEFWIRHALFCFVKCYRTSYLRRTPIFEEPPSSTFGAEEWIKDRTEEGGGWDFLDGGGGFFEYGRGIVRFSGSEERRNPPSFTVSARRTKNPFHLPPSRPEERRTLPSCSSSDPPPSRPKCHQLLSAILSSGSSARSSTLKIGPKIEIGPLLASLYDVMLCLYYVRLCYSTQQ